MTILFSITLPSKMPKDFFTKEQQKDEDAQWLRIKEVMEAYAELIEEETGAEVDIEW